MAGIPTVCVTRSGFEGIVNNAFAGFGFNSEAAKGYIFPTEMFLQGSDLSPIEEHFKEFIEGGLIEWEPEMKELGMVDPEMITVKGTSLAEAEKNVNNIFARNTWRDSLPIEPPTEELVNWILKGSDLDSATAIGTILPRGGIATVRAIAICLAMAGGRPEYLNTTIACVQALCDPNLNMQSWGATTNSCFPVWVISGPLAKEIRMSCGYGLLGPNPSYPAGGVIGRAMRLIMMVIGGQTPGVGTMALFGGARSENAVFAEDYTDLPEGWTTVSEDFGYSKETSTVTISVCNSMTNVLWDFGNVEGNEHALNAMAGCMAAPNALRLSGPVSPALAHDPKLIQGVVLLPKGFVQSIHDVNGMSKADCQKYLWEKSKVSYEYLVECGYANFMGQRDLYHAGDMVPAAPDPEQIFIVCTGGSQGGHGYWMAPFSTGLHTCVEITKPKNWDDLLLDAEIDLGPIPASN